MIKLFKKEKSYADAVKEQMVEPRHNKIKERYEEKFGTLAKEVEEFSGKETDEQALILMTTIQDFGKKLGNINPLAVLPHIFKSVRDGNLTEEQHKKLYSSLRRILDAFPESGEVTNQEEIKQMLKDADTRWEEESKQPEEKEESNDPEVKEDEIDQKMEEEAVKDLNALINKNEEAYLEKILKNGHDITEYIFRRLNEFQNITHTEIIDKVLDADPKNIGTILIYIVKFKDIDHQNLIDRAIAIGEYNLVMLELNALPDTIDPLATVRKIIAAGGAEAVASLLGVLTQSDRTIILNELRDVIKDKDIIPEILDKASFEVEETAQIFSKTPDDLLNTLIQGGHWKAIANNFRKFNALNLPALKELIKNGDIQLHQEEIKGSDHQFIVESVSTKEHNEYDKNGAVFSITFIDKNKKKIDLAELLPTDNCYFRDNSHSRSVLYGEFSYSDVTNCINYNGENMLSKYALPTLLHEIGHAHELRKNRGDKVRSERDAWAYAIRQIRTLKQKGFAIDISDEEIRDFAYSALHTYDKGADNYITQDQIVKWKERPFTKNKDVTLKSDDQPDS